MADQDKQCLELQAKELRVGDEFEYVGSFATYRVESTPVVETTGPASERRVTFEHSRNGAMLGGGRLYAEQPVTVSRAETPKAEG